MRPARAKVGVPAAKSGPLPSSALRLAAALAGTAAVLTGCAQSSLLGIERPDRRYWHGYLTDGRELVTSPRRWERRDWLAFASVAGAAGLAFLNSRPPTGRH